MAWYWCVIIGIVAFDVCLGVACSITNAIIAKKKRKLMLSFSKHKKGGEQI